MSFVNMFVFVHLDIFCGPFVTNCAWSMFYIGGILRLKNNLKKMKIGDIFDVLYCVLLMSPKNCLWVTNIFYENKYYVFLVLNSFIFISDLCT